MDYAAIFGKFLTFPLIFLALIFLLKREIRSLLYRATEYFDRQHSTTDIPKKIEELLKLINSTEVPFLREDDEESEHVGKLPEGRFTKLTQISPQAAIVESWIDVELALFDLGKFKGLPGKMTSKDIADNLEKSGVLKPVEKQIIDELRYISEQIRLKEKRGYVSSHAIAYRSIFLRITASPDQIRAIEQAK